MPADEPYLGFSLQHAEAACEISTPRLRLRRLADADAEFIVDLLNQPSFLQYIGDKKVRTIADAQRYIAEGPGRSYARHGFGLYLVELADERTPIGICGLIKRDTLDDVDVGFAFLPSHWSKGYARESAEAVLAEGRARWGLKRIVAITSPDNVASIRLLEKLGFTFEGMIRLSEAESEVRLFVSESPR